MPKAATKTKRATKKSTSKSVVEKAPQNLDNLTQAQIKALIKEKEERLKELAKKKEIYKKEEEKYEKKAREYETKNKLLFFGHEGKGYLGEHGKWELNPVQKEVFPAWENPRNKIITLTGANRISKAQWDEETVLTPEGFTEIKNIKVGDRVFSSDGEETTVDGVYPQGEIEAYRVTFDDETHLIVSGEHLWVTQGYYERFKKETGHGAKNIYYKKYRVRTTEEIIRSGKYNPETIARNRHIIPMTSPVKFKPVDVPIDPYVLGCLIGDGGLTIGVTFSNPEKEIIDYFVDNGMEIKRLKHGSCDYYVSGLVGKMKSMGLHGKKSSQKFIPKNYLINTEDVRLEVLRGLMDTDGHITKYATIFSTTSPQLVEDIRFLVESLGGKVRVKKYQATHIYNGEKRNGLDSYNVNVMLNNLNPFKLKRKAEQYKGRYYCQSRIIKKIEKLPNKLPCTCIKVSHSSHLYLAKNFIVTHNTFSTFCMLLCAMYGRWPWEDDSRTGWFWDRMGWTPPIKIRWIGQDWEKHIKTVLEPKFDELWPHSRPIEVKKNNIGVRAFWKDLKTGSSLEIMSNKQESDLFEGWNGHLVAYDEPPKRDNRVACARGLIDYRGREIFAMTLLKEAWVDQEVVNATNEDGTPDMSVYNYNAEIDVNIGYGITQEGVDQFSKTLTEEEKQARLKGIPSYKSGLVLHIDRQKHLISRPNGTRIPTHWVVDIAIDIHPRKPQHILFQATDEHNFKYLIFEVVGHGDGDWIGDQIIEKITRYNLRVNEIVIDPLAKADDNNPLTVYEKVRVRLSRFGYTLRVATKWKDDGILLINDMLWSKNGMASYFIFNDLPVTTKQLMGWMYDESGKPSKDNDDMCENAYRLALLNTQYVDPEDEDDIYESNEAVLSGRDAGY